MIKRRIVRVDAGLRPCAAAAARGALPGLVSRGELGADGPKNPKRPADGPAGVQRELF